MELGLWEELTRTVFTYRTICGQGELETPHICQVLQYKKEGDSPANFFPPAVSPIWPFSPSPFGETETESDLSADDEEDVGDDSADEDSGDDSGNEDDGDDSGDDEEDGLVNDGDDGLVDDEDDEEANDENDENDEDDEATDENAEALFAGYIDEEDESEHSSLALEPFSAERVAALLIERRKSVKYIKLGDWLRLCSNPLHLFLELTSLLEEAEKEFSDRTFFPEAEAFTFSCDFDYGKIAEKEKQELIWPSRLRKVEDSLRRALALFSSGREAGKKRGRALSRSGGCEPDRHRTIMTKAKREIGGATVEEAEKIAKFLTRVAETWEGGRAGDWTAETQTRDLTAGIQTRDLTAETQTRDLTAGTQTRDWTAETQTRDWTAETQTRDWTAETQTRDWPEKENLLPLISRSFVQSLDYGPDLRAQISDLCQQLLKRVRDLEEGEIFKSRQRPISRALAWWLRACPRAVVKVFTGLKSVPLLTAIARDFPGPEGWLERTIFTDSEEEVAEFYGQHGSCPQTAFERYRRCPSVVGYARLFYERERAELGDPSLSFESLKKTRLAVYSTCLKRASANLSVSLLDIYYRPGGPGYHKAKEDFYKLCDR